MLRTLRTGRGDRRDKSTASHMDTRAHVQNRKQPETLSQHDTPDCQEPEHRPLVRLHNARNGRCGREKYIRSA
jgi:hypothetical protein